MSQGFTDRRFAVVPVSTFGTNPYERSSATLTASGSINTLGSYSQLIASTAATYHGFWIHLRAASSSTATYMLNIATGAGGAESVIIPNYFFINCNGAVGQLAWFAVKIAAGTRIAANVQSTAASQTVVLELWGDATTTPPFLNTTAVAYGANTGTTLGTSVTTGINVYGNWTSIGTTSRDHYGWVICNGGAATQPANSLYDVGYGPNSGSVTTVVAAMEHNWTNAVANYFSPPFFWGFVASGSQMWMKISGDGTARTASVVLEGI